MILTGSNGLSEQFEGFIKKNIPFVKVTIKKIKNYSRLYVYRYTAR